MIKSKFKRVTSLFLATLMCVTTFAGIGSTTAYAASGEKADVYMVDFPRDGDANYDGVWGHSNLTLKNGWHTGRSNFTNLKAIGSYSGNVAYCIEPGISLKVGQTMNKYDENYFNNLASNGVISGDEIRLFVGRILQYGYRGTISTSWRSQNEAAANSIAQAYATQLLIWETVIGERDVNFNHVSASGCSNVKDVINARHPLRNKIFSYYNSMVQSVQNHATIPSFCNKSSGSAKTIELEWNGSKYTTTLTDSNNVLSKYNFKASISGVNFSVNGNKLTVSMDTAPSKEFTIMQAAEGSFNTRYPHEPNGIKDPEYSIQCGVQELKAALTSAEVESPIDMEHIKLALQGYNFGNGYISWAKTKYGGYSYANAVEFSTQQAQRLGWDSYGDTQYPAHVLRYYPYGRAFTAGGNQAIVEVALTQLGNQGGQPYWSWYGFNSRVEWCACFVSWCADQCGYIESGLVPKFAGCVDGANWFKSNGKWQDRTYEPKVGDIIFFDWEGDGTTDHVGIVEKCENGTVYTVEGNSGDACKQRQYAVGSSNIYGYGIPAY